MPNQYYTILTNSALAKQAAANNPGGSLINLTQMAVGDESYEPVASQTALVHEVYRTNLTHVAIDVNNPNQLIVEAVINETIGPFYIREVGIFDSNGDLFALGKYPETYKSTSAIGSGKRLYIRMILAFSNAPEVNLIQSEDLNNDPNFSSNVLNSLNEINNDLSTIDNNISAINSDLNQKLAKNQNLADLADLNQARINLQLAITGAIMPFASLTPPSGWLHCDGAEVSKTSYQRLFEVIGTNFGSSNANGFKIPDLRGEFIRGLDSNRGIDPNRVLGSSQAQDWKSFNMWNSYGATNSYSHNPVYMAKYTSNPGNVFDMYGGYWAAPSGRMGLYWDSSEIRPRNVALLMCIKY